MLVNPPANRTSVWWKYFQVFHIKHKDKRGIACCRICGTEIRVGKGTSGLKSHARSHKDNEEIKEQTEEEMITKRRKLATMLKESPKKSKEQWEQDILNATVAWVIEENQALNKGIKTNDKDN